MSERRRWGANTHRTIYQFCGGVHQSKREKRECRLRQGSLPVEKPEQRESHAGTPTTRYEHDPAKGDKQAHAILKKSRRGMDARKIAKHLNLNVDDVREVITKASR